MRTREICFGALVGFSGSGARQVMNVVLKKKGNLDRVIVTQKWISA